MNSSDTVQIILPKNTGLKDAYISILKLLYLEQCDTYLFQNIIYAVQSDCGISEDTASNRCKQLNSLELLRYVCSGLAGHVYKICIYTKDKSGEISHVNNLLEASSIIETQFSDIIETEFLQIKKMNASGLSPSGAGFSNAAPAKHAVEELDLLINAQQIRKQSDDPIKSVIETEYMSGYKDKDKVKAEEKLCRDIQAELNRNTSQNNCLE